MRRVHQKLPKRSLGGGTALVIAISVLVLAAGSLAAQTPKVDPDQPWLRPYTGPTRADIDATTLDGKVLCGYQGWFNTPGDGTDFGFGHWGQGLDRPGGGRFTVDMWPDTSEYDPRDLCDVPGLKMPDGSPARLYSAFKQGPVLLHFKWMRQYGIDGVFLSRFVGETTSPARARHVNTVLASVREGCHREGRVWAMMLDLSMGRRGSTATVINDWKFLCDKVKVREDSRYLHHQGKPVVLLWGLGFHGPPLDGRAGRGTDQLLQERPAVRRRLPDRRGRPLLADAARRIAAGSGLGEGLPDVRRHQPLGRRPIPGRRQHGPAAQGGLGRRPGRVEGPGGSATCRRRSLASRGTTCAGRSRARP